MENDYTDLALVRDDKQTEFLGRRTAQILTERFNSARNKVTNRQNAERKKISVMAKNLNIQQGFNPLFSHWRFQNANLINSLHRSVISDTLHSLRKGNYFINLILFYS